MPEYTSTPLEDGRFHNEFKIDLMAPKHADLYVLGQRKERMWAEDGIGRLRHLGIATSMDVDDNYVDVPEYNPAFYGLHPYRRGDGVILNRAMRRAVKTKEWGYKPPSNKMNYRHFLAALTQVDLVTVSTPFLAEVYSPYNGNIKVIRNYVDWDIWEDVEPQYEVQRERVRIGYLGVFRYRRGDLQLLQRVMPKFMRDHPEVDFVANTESTHAYLGIPEKQRVTVGEYSFQSEGDLPLGRMTAVCDIGLVPLVLNDLNQGKSHLKGMEYNAAGIPFVASPTESYKDYWCSKEDSGMLAESEDDWYSLMELYVDDETIRRNHGLVGREKAKIHSIQNHWKKWYDPYAHLIGDDVTELARRSITLGAIQKTSELAPFLRLIKERRPKTVVEIGTAKGGTLWAMSQVIPEDATIVSIDIPAGSVFDRKNGEDVYSGRNREAIKMYTKQTQKLALIDLDSQSEAAQRALAHTLGERKIDLLFIDGDHSYEGVKADYDNYLPFVSPQGLIAFHDIVTTEDKRVGVPRFWNELKADHHAHEFIGQESWGHIGWGGIGVIEKENVCTTA